MKPSHFPLQFLDKNLSHRLHWLAHSDQILPFSLLDVGPENPPYAEGFGMTQGSCKSATRSQIDSEAFCQAVAVRAKCESRGHRPVPESDSCVCVRVCVSVCVCNNNEHNHCGPLRPHTSSIALPHLPPYRSPSLFIPRSFLL